MTKLWIISDLHLRLPRADELWEPPVVPAADICVVAGDICDRVDIAVKWLGHVVGKHMPVVMVLGNHEYWGSSLNTAVLDAKKTGKDIGVTVLANETAVLRGVRFIGATLWADFNLPIGGRYKDMPAAEVKADAIRISKREFADFAEIYATEVGPGGQMARFINARDMGAEFEQSKAYLASELAKPFAGVTVALTHHAPHPGSVAAEFAIEATTAGYVSDLGAIIEDCGPDYWVHGHTHTRFDYKVARTRVICNPGPWDRKTPAMDWNLVLEV